MARKSNETNTIINNKLNTLNRLLGLATETCTPDGKGGYNWNPGVFHCERQYGGYRLVRMSRHGGSGTEDPINMGVVNGSVMVDIINTMIVGIQLGKEYAKKP